MTEELPQLEDLSDSNIEKYLPWSKNLPKDVCNFEGEYKELKA